MGRDMRSIKFEMFIKEIRETMGEYMTGKPEDVDKEAPIGFRYGIKDGAWMALIYDYSKLNEYGKIIMEITCNYDKKYANNETNLLKKYEDEEYRIKEAKNFIDGFNKSWYSSGYRSKSLRLAFIFWALMILTVDDTDKEEHLSQICDFVRMLKLTDEDVEDMVQIIRLIYHEVEGECRINNSFEDYYSGIPGKHGVYFRALLKKYVYSTVKIIDKNGKCLNEDDEIG